MNKFFYIARIDPYVCLILCTRVILQVFLCHVCVVLQVDAIVNSTDTSLQLDVDPLSRSILEAGGDTLRDECQKNAPNGKLEYGEVVVTSGGQLQCKFVIHGAACKWTDGNCKEVRSRTR